jgi:hypothetical protein
VEVVGRLRAHVDGDERDGRLEMRRLREPPEIDALLAEPPLEPAAPRVLADATGERDLRTGPGGDHGHVGRSTTEVRNERVGLVPRGDGLLADDVDESLPKNQNARAHDGGA